MTSKEEDNSEKNIAKRKLQDNSWAVRLFCNYLLFLYKFPSIIFQNILVNFIVYKIIIDNAIFFQIRPCFLYKEEYNECKSIRGRFHQYFIFGESIDCMSWIRDYDNCVQYEDKQDLHAGTAIIASEEKRRYDRIKSHYDNDIWKKRNQPPDDWNKPLPEWLQKKIENSYLTIKAKELNEQGLAGDSDQMKNRTICSIM